MPAESDAAGVRHRDLERARRGSVLGVLDPLVHDPDRAGEA